MEKPAILEALRTFARQRPGLDFANYGDVALYRSESRQISRDLAHAQTLLGAVEWSGVTADDILRAADGGRLNIRADGQRVRIDYTTGQYWPTEYRRAVCRVLASALWDSYRDGMSGEVLAGRSPGDRIRSHFRRAFGRAIADRYFN